MSPSRGSSRGTVARHARLTSPRPVGQVLTLLAVALVVVLIGGATIAGFYAWNAVAAVSDKSVTLENQRQLPPSIGEIEGGVNLLVVGTDSCEGQSLELFPRCGAKDAGGERNDVTMLVHIGDDPRRVTVVSFPRDLLVPIPSCTNEDGRIHSASSAEPLNASYMYGGLACTAKTISALTEMDIDFAAAIRWTGVINISNAIGGVDVCLADDIDDRETNLHLTAGTHNLQGAEALQFLRMRKGIGDGSDLGRISNQQQFLSSLIRKLRSDEVLADPGRLFTLANTAIQQVNEGQLRLDDNLSNPTRMVQIAMAVKDVPYEDIVFLQYPNAGHSDGIHVVPLREPATVLFQALTDNKAIALTGTQGKSQNLVGEVAPPQPSESAPASPSPGTTATDPPPDPDADAVALPSEITGQTANQETCTKRNR